MFVFFILFMCVTNISHVSSSSPVLLSSNFNYTNVLFHEVKLSNVRNYSEQHISDIDNFSRCTIFEQTFCNKTHTPIVLKKTIKRFYYMTMCVKLEGEQKIKYQAYSLPSYITINLDGVEMEMNILFSYMYTLLQDIETNKTFLTFSHMLQSYFYYIGEDLFNPQIDILNKNESFLNYGKTPLYLLSFDFDVKKIDILKLLRLFPLFISFETDINISKDKYLRYYIKPQECLDISEDANHFAFPVSSKLNISGYISEYDNCGNYSFVYSNKFVFKTRIVSQRVSQLIKQHSSQYVSQYASMYASQYVL
ncbi:hypothetical protein Yalta_082 [Yalta virus]|nr:hypothetical protein Yalta_082 [Yalta virus]